MADENNNLTLLQEAAATASDDHLQVEETELPDGFFESDEAEMIDSAEAVTQVFDDVPEEAPDDKEGATEINEETDAQEEAETSAPEGQARTRAQTRTRRRPAGRRLYTGGQAQEVETPEEAIARQATAVRNNPRAIYTGIVSRVPERDGRLAVEIKGIEITTLGSGDNISLPKWTALIAPQHFMEGTSEIESLAQLRNLLSNWIGGRIEFMPFNTDTVKPNFDKMLIAGDRNAAQHLLTRNHWLNRNGIRKGDSVQGTINFVTPHVIGVSAFGVNQLLPANKCLPAGVFSSDLRTYVDLNDKKPYFVTGKKIALRVDELERKRTDNGSVEISVSLSTELSHENDDLDLDEYKTNDRLVGYVDGIGTNNGTTVYVKLELERLTVRCGWGPEYAVPDPGTKVHVRVAGTVTTKDGRKILVGNILPH